MRVRFFLFVFLLIFVNFGMSQNPKDSLIYNVIAKRGTRFICPEYDSIVRKYTVHKIKKIDKAYLIAIKAANGFVFTIISLKCKEQKGERIRKGRKYNFLLHSYGESRPPNSILMGGPGHGQGVKILACVEDTILCFDADLIKSRPMVTTPNLRGLYYVRN